MSAKLTGPLVPFAAIRDADNEVIVVVELCLSERFAFWGESGRENVSAGCALATSYGVTRPSSWLWDRLPEKVQRSWGAI